MRTLVIHPKDPTTDFLEAIYKDHADWTVLRDPLVSSRILKDSIRAHDRVIILGHGTQDGLIAATSRQGGYIANYRYVIDSSWVQALRPKDTVCIWCNADKFVEKYDLKGLYTGMIVSEYEEALMYSVSCMMSDITESNYRFANAMKIAVISKDMAKVAKSYYISEDNHVIAFNRANIYER